MQFIACLGALAFILQVVAQDFVLQVDTPTDVHQCEEVLLTWRGTAPPFLINVGRVGSDTIETAAVDTRSITHGVDGNRTWKANFPVGWQMYLEIPDVVPRRNQSGPFTILPGPDGSCLDLADVGSIPGSSGSGIGGIVGGTIGGVVIAIVVALGIWHGIRRRRQKKFEEGPGAEPGREPKVEDGFAGIKGGEISYQATTEWTPPTFVSEAPGPIPATEAVPGEAIRAQKVVGAVEIVASSTPTPLPPAPTPNTSPTPLTEAGMSPSQAEAIQNLLSSNAPRETIATVVQLMATAGHGQAATNPEEAPPRYEG